MSRFALVVIAAFAAAAGAAGASPIAEAQWAKAVSLGPRLSEVSGLAPAGSDSVFAHNDEAAVVHEVRIADGSIIRSFALGRPAAVGDFEGVVLADGELYLTTSAGRLYRVRPAADREHASFASYDSGLAGVCDVEGVSASGRPGGFLFLCKQSLKARRSQRLQIYEWSLAAKAPARLAVDIPFADLLPAGAKGRFLPSDLVRDARTGDLFILNVRGGILHLTAGGERVAFRALDRRRHMQPEGLAILADGRILIADEGKSGGTLSIYRRP
jgi:hypothetical protein